MRAVVEGYQQAGLFEAWRVELISPHVEGGMVTRLRTAAVALARYMWLLVTGQVGLVHCHAAMKGSFWRKSVFGLLGRLFGIPVIFHLHGSEMKTFVDSQPRAVRRLIAWVLCRYSVVVVLSQSWYDYVKALAPEADVQIVPNYVELPDLRERLEDEPDARPKFLFLGLVGQRKGVYDLLPAAASALRSVPFELTIGGNGEVEKSVAMTEQLGASDHIRFAGWVSGGEKAALLRAADVYVLPSHNEGLPVSLLEAMSWGVPVISTRVGGIPELVTDGVDGLLIDAGDRKALEDALTRLASDVELRRAMGAAARARVASTYSREVVLPMIERLYGRLSGAVRVPTGGQA